MVGHLSRLKGERVDMWVVRFNNEAPLHYWGLKQLGEIESEAMLQQAGSVLFVDGPRPSPPASVRDVAAWYPGAPQHRLLQVGCCPSRVARYCLLSGVTTLQDLGLLAGWLGGWVACADQRPPCRLCAGRLPGGVLAMPSWTRQPACSVTLLMCGGRASCCGTKCRLLCLHQVAGRLKSLL